MTMHYTPDPADQFIANVTGQPLSIVCRPQIDIQKRVGGASFPLHFVASGDIIPLHYADGALFAADPLDILIARESVEFALDADSAGDYLALAAIQEIDTLHIAKQEKITRRRAQQIKAEKIALAAAGQREFNFGGEEDE